MARRKHQNIDYVILVSVILLIIFGFAALASASSDLGKSNFDDTYFYLKNQVLHGLSFGIIGFLAGYFIDYRKYKKFAPILLLVTLGLLILTFSPLGISSGGARRWIEAGPITLQPSELLKIVFIVYLAAWLSSSRADRQKNVSEGLLPFLGISGIVGILLLLQRSTSAAIILLTTALTMYFVSGAKKKHIFTAIALGLLVISIFVLLTPYRLERIKTFLDPSQEAQESGYQLKQALVTIGSGGWTGVGYGESSLKAYLPERIGDSIFAIIAEEFGFVGSVVLLLTFLLLIMRILILAKNSRDEFGRLLLVGFATILGLQAFIHIGGNSGLIPLTGVPLPFISFGGTALAVFMTMSGIVLNIGKRI